MGCLSAPPHSLGANGGGTQSKPWAKATLLSLGFTLDSPGTCRNVDAQAAPQVDDIRLSLGVSPDICFL